MRRWATARTTASCGPARRLGGTETRRRETRTRPGARRGCAALADFSTAVSESSESRLGRRPGGRPGGAAGAWDRHRSPDDSARHLIRTVRSPRSDSERSDRSCAIPGDSGRRPIPNDSDRRRRGPGGRGGARRWRCAARPAPPRGPAALRGSTHIHTCIIKFPRINTVLCTYCGGRREVPPHCADRRAHKYDCVYQ